MYKIRRNFVFIYLNLLITEKKLGIEMFDTVFKLGNCIQMALNINYIILMQYTCPFSY